ncbi:MAG: radical SAM protein [Leptolyngbyaceae cyanobacterium MO_188.B28]|nr:radical SAM protein [Leptolyngbyaceae cyanobacterium MO_188.B28]
MKIGLISLSGIQVHDQELLNRGLTLPGIVERSKVIASLPNLGLLILGGLTPPEHQLKYVDIDDLGQLNSLDNDFDLVAISSYSARIREAYQMANYFQQRNMQVVMGGLHVSSLPQEAAQYCDSVLVGEGELLWPKVIRDAEAGVLKPIYNAKGQEFDLKNAPMPAYHLLDPEKYNRITVQTGRGCPYRCEFCASSILITQKYKQKPIEKVLKELDTIQAIWKRPFIEFVDDNAFINKSYWKKLLTQMKSRKLHWFAETDISVSEDEQLLQLMQESGCVQILVGLESPTIEGLEGIELRNNWKKNKLPSYLEAIHKIQSHGIRVIGCFIVGLDGHDSKIFDQVYQFSIDSELFDIQITLPTPFPGTPFYSRLRQAGRLLEPEAWDRCTLFDLNFKPNYMSVSELRDGFRDLVMRLYSDELTTWRKSNFKKYIKQLSYQN